MTVTVIPFNMPEPMEIPSHVVEMLSEMDSDEAVCKGMELLMGIEAADTIVYDRISDEGLLELHAVIAGDGRAASLEHTLRQESFYGKPLSSAGNSLTGVAFEKESSLLIMGEISGGDDDEPLPVYLRQGILNGNDRGNVGFVYVLTLTGSENEPAGSLTLIRTQENGPLNHEQPNITEGLRQLLCQLLQK